MLRVLKASGGGKMEPTLNDLQRTRFRRYMQCKIAKEREKSEEGRQREKGRERKEMTI